ncbi:MAG: hypothetical protein WCS94_20460 [Verrucomicrobiota bacterium]
MRSFFFPLTTGGFWWVSIGVINENNRATLGGAGCYSHPAQLVNCVMIGGGLALMMLPSIVVGNEILILGGVLGVVAA